MMKKNSTTMKHTPYTYYALVILVLMALVYAPEMVSAAQLTNPLGSADTPNEVIANVIRGFLGIVGALTLLVFVYGGFMMLTSAGNSDKVQKGRETLMWAAIGLIVIFGAYGFADALFTAFSG